MTRDGGLVLAPGARVVHPVHGPGRVLALRGGARAHVAFDARPKLPKVVSRAALDFAAPQRTHEKMAQPEPEPDLRRPVPSSGAAEAWQSIEALRLGVVPPSLAEAYTVGREAELASLARLLDAGQGIRLLFGDYGHGKTHLLDVVEQLARKSGFVTARATLDPAEVPPSHPLRLYRALMGTFRCPDAPDASPLPVLERLAEREDHLKPSGSRYSRFLSPALAAIARGSHLAPELLRYVLGHDVDVDEVSARMRRYGLGAQSLLKLSDYRTFGRLYAYLLGTWASFCKDAGYEGLVLLFDEVERVSALSAEQLRLAEQVLRSYAAAVLPRPQLAFDPDSAHDVYRGGQRVHQELPLRFAADQPLAIVMALTPAPEVLALVSRIVDPKAVRVDLLELPRALRGALIDRVSDRYRVAYPGFTPEVDAQRRLRERLLAAEDGDDLSPRQVVRAAVFHLDAMRLAKRAS